MNACRRFSKLTRLHGKQLWPLSDAPASRHFIETRPCVCTCRLKQEVELKSHSLNLLKERIAGSEAAQLAGQVGAPCIQVVDWECCCTCVHTCVYCSPCIIHSSGVIFVQRVADLRPLGQDELRQLADTSVQCTNNHCSAQS